MSDAPFLALVDHDPGTDEGLWARQLLALRALERLGSGELEAVRGRLQNHPSAAIRQWLGEQQVAAMGERLVSKVGDIELVQIPAGRFEMGSPKSEEGRYDDEGPQHRVTVPAFAIGRYAVTNEEYARFLSSHPDATEPQYWGDRKYNQARQPVVGVSWEDARRFAVWAGGRLPTEAEWEYAARAGTTARYLVGSTKVDLDRMAWNVENSGSSLHPVGRKEPNAWGLYDVLGNVYEWVEDDWHGTYVAAPSDGSAWVDEPRSAHRVVRGGSFFDTLRFVRAAYRYGYGPDFRNFIIGFRVVVSPFSS